MKALKIIGNIFGVLIAIILSVALFAMLIATPVITSLGLVTKPETVHAVITQPEVVEMITELPGVSENLEAAGMDKEFIHEVTQSQFFEDVVHLYTEQTVDGVTGESTEHVTVEQVQEVIENNKEEVIDLVRPISGNYTEDGEIPSDEEIEEMIDYAVENYAQDFLDSLPSGQELLDMLEGYSGDISGLIGSYGPAGGDTVGAPLKMSLPGGDLMEGLQSGDAQRFYSAVIRFVLDGTAQKVLIAAIVLLSVLILLFRFPRFKGFMWLTVIYLLGGAILMACSVLLTYRPFEEELAHYFHIAVVIFELIAVHIRHYAIAFLIVGAACLVVFIIGRIVLKLVKRSKAKKTVAAKTETQPTVIAANVPEAVTAAAAVVAPVVEIPAEEVPEEEETEAEEILAEEEEAPAEEETPAEEEAPAEDEAAAEKEACTEEVLEEEAEAEEAPAEEPKAEEIVTAE